MKVVYILGDQQERIIPIFPIGFLEFGQSGMSGVGCYVFQFEPTTIVEIIDHFRISLEPFRRADILQSDLRPDAAFIPKGVQTGFTADSGSGQDDNTFQYQGFPSLSL